MDLVQLLAESLNLLLARSCPQLLGWTPWALGSPGSSGDPFFPLYREQAGRPKCPLDPYFIMPDKCKCVDFQTLKLQELPDAVPHGEMPRHMQLYCDR